MTRYPKSGKGGKWTVIELKAISPDWKGDTLSDGNGLSGDVRLSSINEVSIAFRYGFKQNGKKVWYYCGTFPFSDIATIRADRDQAREQVADGIDPRSKKKTDKIDAQAQLEAKIADAVRRQVENLTFDDLFNTWIKDGVNRADGNKYIIQSFKKHVLPIIGNKPLRELSENHLRDIYRSIILQGHLATAVEVSKDVKQMLRWGEQRKPWRALMIDGNPANLVGIDKLLPANYVKERDRVLSVGEIQKLQCIFIDIEKAYVNSEVKSTYERPLKKEVQLAIWICLGSICRIGELLMTEWSHVDFNKKTWLIPKENTKGMKGKKQDQLVYLSDFVLKKFEELHSFNGNCKWVFPARYNEGHVCLKSASKQVGDRQVSFKKRTKKLQFRVENNSLVLGDREWTPHDLRRTGATMMQELKVPRDIINLCQNHIIGSKVDRSYLHHKYEDEKQEAWFKLGCRIEEVLLAA